MDTRAPDLTDLADEGADADQWAAWLRDHADAATEVEVARRVRVVLLQMQAAHIPLPADFQARLMRRLREDTTVMHLTDLGLSAFAQAILELVAAFFSLLPAPPPRTAT